VREAVSKKQFSEVRSTFVSSTFVRSFDRQHNENENENENENKNECQCTAHLRTHFVLNNTTVRQRGEKI